MKLVTSSRCLGVQLDHELKWGNHFNSLIKSYTKKLSLLRSIYFLPLKPRTDLYFKVILPSIMYGIAVWGSCSKTHFTELEKIHVRAAKIIFKLDSYIPSAEVLSSVKWPSLENIYTTRTLVLAHSVFYCNVPSQVQNIFAKYHCKYDLRGGNCFALPKPKTNFLLKSVHYRAAKRWNSLPNHLRAIENLGPFKKGLRLLEDNDQKLSIS